MLPLFFKGIIIGFSIAAPIGPIGTLCINQSLNYGFKIGLLTGLGAASVHGLYGFIASFGLTAISTILVTQQFWIRLIGGFFLIYLGINLLISPYKEHASSNMSPQSPWRAYVTTIFLALINPMTICYFAAIFAVSGIGVSQNYLDAPILVTGIMIGSSLWWVILSGVMAYISNCGLSIVNLRRINILSGFVMLSFAAIMLWSSVGQTFVVK